MNTTKPTPQSDSKKSDKRIPETESTSEHDKIPWDKDSEFTYRLEEVMSERQYMAAEARAFALSLVCTANIRLRGQLQSKEREALLENAYALDGMSELLGRPFDDQVDQVTKQIARCGALLNSLVAKYGN